MAEFFAALGRRWYVVGLGLLATAVLTWGAASLSPPSYHARGLVVLLPPSEFTEDGGNPFLGLGGLEVPARVLVAYFASESAQAGFAESAPDAEVAVSLDDSTRGPVLAIDVSDVTPDSALSTLRLVADAIPVNLARLQAEVGAPRGTTVTSLELAMDPEAEVDHSDMVRISVITAVAGIAGTLLMAIAVDRVMGRRASPQE